VAVRLVLPLPIATTRSVGAVVDVPLRNASSSVVPAVTVAVGALRAAFTSLAAVTADEMSLVDASRVAVPPLIV